MRGALTSVSGRPYRAEQATAKPRVVVVILAKRIAIIFASLSFEEALECTEIHSVSDLLPGNAALVTTGPFRSPRQSVSDASLIGGGSIPKPGEVSLAHRGTLFLDELPEFKREVLEVRRQPLED